MEDRVISSVDLRKELGALPKQQGYSSGYKGLDFYINEFREGDLVIITGMTGEGKSAYAVSLSKNFIEQGITPMWFSYELSSTELLERFGKQLPLFYLPRLLTSKAGEWIEKKIKEAKTNFGAKAIFIDHLHYLTDDVAVRNRNLPEILGNLCRKFKMIARQERIMIFLLAHTRKLRSDKHRPTIDDLKDASGIGQEADTVLIIQRRGKRRSKNVDADLIPELSTDVRIWIDKNRRTGRLGYMDMMFDQEEMVHKEIE